MLPEPLPSSGGSAGLDPHRAAREDLAVLMTFAEVLLEGLAGPVQPAQRAHLEEILARADELEAQTFGRPKALDRPPSH